MPKKVVVVGAGPVGSLAALYAAKRGLDVEVYELRDDLRKQETTPLNFTKSINLALSERGINALRCIGSPQLLDRILTATTPMYGRMVHTRSKSGQIQEQSQAYDVHGRFQRSVDRSVLNKQLLNELSSLSNVQVFFRHKLVGADFRVKRAWLERGATAKEEIEITFDLMLGADGAHSAVRYHMMKFARVNYHQEYIDSTWCEFTMKPRNNTSPHETLQLGGSAETTSDFAISANHLHIWPAGDSMFIALPNLDKSFVCTLFGPQRLFKEFEACIQSPIAEEEDFSILFSRYFPGVVPGLISSSDLMDQFKHNPHLPLITIKCTPHHFSDAAVIVGDAASAVVPFYGQGMNAGMESVRVLFDYLDHYPSNWSKALSSYTETRTKDAHAIADLALGNYAEMRAGVTEPLYKLRKYLEETLDKYLPQLGWATQYSRVSFSNEPYHEIVQKSMRQKRAFEGIVRALHIGAIATVAVLGMRFFKARRGRP